MEQTPLKTLPPWLQSPVGPVFVKSEVPLKVAPLRYRVGLEEVKPPLKVDAGPTVRLPVPVSVRFSATTPVCVNCRSSKVPLVKPAGPTKRAFANVTVAVTLLLQNCTPVPLVEVTVMLLLNIVPVE